MKKWMMLGLMLFCLHSYATLPRLYNDNIAKALNQEENKAEFDLKIISSDKSFYSLGVEAGDLKEYFQHVVWVLKEEIINQSIKGDFRLAVQLESYKPPAGHNCKKDYTQCVMQNISFSGSDPDAVERVEKRLMKIPEIRINNFLSKDSLQFIITLTN